MRTLIPLTDSWQFARLPQSVASPPAEADMAPVSLPHIWNRDDPAAEG